MAATFRNTIRWLVPAWLYSGEGKAKLDAVGDAVDENVQRLRNGITARFPHYAAERDDGVALRWLGRDRGILRGRSETAAHYAGRLCVWRYPRGHRVRGSAYGLLEQVTEYFGDELAAAWTISQNGVLSEYDVTDDTWTTTREIPWTWDTRSATEWSSFWLGLDSVEVFSAQPSLGDPSLWGGELGSDGGYTVGVQGFTVDDVAAVRGLVSGAHPWRPAGTQPEWLIVNLQGDEGAEPTEAWQYWSSDNAGVREYSRNPELRYISLDPEHNNYYAGRELWSSHIPLVSGVADRMLKVGVNIADVWYRKTMPDAALVLWINIVASGGLGDAAFEWSTDSGVTWSSTIYITSWVIDLGDVGYEVTFQETSNYTTGVGHDYELPNNGYTQGDPSNWPTTLLLPNRSATLIASGTSPPDVMIVAAPSGGAPLDLRVHTAGYADEAFFDFSLDGGQTWTLENQVMPEVTVGDFMLAFEFDTQYSLDNTWTRDGVYTGRSDSWASAVALVDDGSAAS